MKKSNYSLAEIEKFLDNNGYHHDMYGDIGTPFNIYSKAGSADIRILKTITVVQSSMLPQILGKQLHDKFIK